MCSEQHLHHGLFFAETHGPMWSALAAVFGMALCVAQVEITDVRLRIRAPHMSIHQYQLLIVQNVP